MENTMSNYPENLISLNAEIAEKRTRSMRYQLASEPEKLNLNTENTRTSIPRTQLKYDNPGQRYDGSKFKN